MDRANSPHTLGAHVSISNGAAKYTEISSGDANAHRELIGETYSFCFPLNRDQLPEPLQNIKTLVTGFVSGVRDGVPSPVGSGKMLEVHYTVRNEAKDAPLTGNANAYCVLEVGEKFY